MDEYDFQMLAGNLYGDLRRVLTPVIGLAGMLQREDMVEPMHDVHRETALCIERNGRYALLLVEYHYHMLRLRAGDSVLALCAYDLNQALSRALAVARHAFDQRQTTLTLLPSSAVAMIAADREYLDMLVTHVVWELQRVPITTVTIQTVVEDTGIRWVTTVALDTTVDTSVWPSPLITAFTEAVVTAHHGVVEWGHHGRWEIWFPAWEHAQQ